MPKPKNPNAQTIKNIRKATAVYIYTMRKPSKSQWFPDIETFDTIEDTMLACMKAIDEANDKFAK
jgi:predicted amino acid racemase